MLIRSQEKGRLINLNNAKHIGISEYERKKDARGRGYYAVDGGYGAINPNVFIITADGFIMGVYPAMEKAIKVLDMIQDFYNNCFAFSMEDDGYYHEESLIKVFQMPQDSEVGE